MLLYSVGSCFGLSMKLQNIFVFVILIRVGQFFCVLIFCISYFCTYPVHVACSRFVIYLLENYSLCVLMFMLLMYLLFIAMLMLWMYLPCMLMFMLGMYFQIDLYSCLEN